MRYAVLGTGVVGRTIAGKLISLGHEVVIGTRDPQVTLARTESDGYGNPPYSQWQAEHPQVRLENFTDAKVVKTLNTMNAQIMVAPARVPGSHNVFVSGDDAEAKEAVAELLVSFGWPAGDIIDLGGITTARGAEMLLPLWLHLYGALGNADFNFHIQGAHHSA